MVGLVVGVVLGDEGVVDMGWAGCRRGGHYLDYLPTLGTSKVKGESRENLE